MILDLGCGGNLHPGATGVDITPNGTAASIICNLGFEPIPVESDSVEKCISHHFIEHVPFAVWYREQAIDFVPAPEYRAPYEGYREKVSSWLWKRYLPMVYLFNEVYRVLHNRGTFYVTVPLVINGHIPHQQGFQDITHVSFWTPETVRYFSGDYYAWHDVYGHTSRFLLDWVDLSPGWFMRFQMTAIKDLPSDHPYLLNY